MRIATDDGLWHFGSGPTLSALEASADRLLLLIDAYREGLTRRALIDGHAPRESLRWVAMPWIGWELRGVRGDVIEALARVWVAGDPFRAWADEDPSKLSVRFEWMGEPTAAST